ncbi:MAG TPA: YbjN domain-containing protein [Methanocorpusculum sp.]|nr:YbjN domain-containing protein [Methanocorpusculum sp.]
MSTLPDSVTAACETLRLRLHFRHTRNGESTFIEFEQFTSLICPTANSRGLADLSLLFIDIPQDRILETLKLVNYLNEDIEFGKFTFLESQNKISYYLTAFIPEGTTEDQNFVIIRELIELSLTYIENAKESVRLLAETRMTAEEIFEKSTLKGTDE